MPDRITIYCRQKVNFLTIEDIKAWIAEADWLSLAEFYDIEDEESVNQTISSLTPQGDNGFFQIYFGSLEKRPLEIDIINDEMLVKEEIDELINSNKKIAPLMNGIVEIISISAGYFQLVGVKEVVAYELTRQFAVIGNGIFVDTEGGWWKTIDWQFVKIN